MKKRLLLTILIVTFYSVPAWAEVTYYFDEYYPTLYSATHIVDINLNGSITWGSPWQRSYTLDGAHTTGNSMLSWQWMDDFTGTLRYTNANFCDSQCVNWDSDNCYFIDHYNNGVRSIDK